MKPIVSVILPTYNGKAEWLSESIDSVLNQTFKDFELIIINDASTNNIEETILKYKGKDSRIVYFKNNVNLKLAGSLNLGISHCRGKYIARIDDDDIWVSKNKLEKQVDFMELNEQYGLCGAGKVIIIDQQGDEIDTFFTRFSDREIRSHMLQSNQIAHASVLIRKSVLDTVGLYDIQYNPAEDYDLWCRLGRTAKICNLKDVIIKYRINKGGMTQKNVIKMKKQSFLVFLKNREHYPHFLSALFLRLGDFIIPEGFRRRILKIIKKG